MFTVSLHIKTIIFFLFFHNVMSEDDLNSAGRNNYWNGVQEYCLYEEFFEAQCLKNEVIVIISAAYGRMHIGRCLEDEGIDAHVSNDPRSLGCSVDVVALMDRKCFGKNRCELKSLEPDRKRERPCHASLKQYLEVAYDCVTVVEPDRSCLVSVTSNPIHIMRSSVTQATQLKCGTQAQPWILEAPLGQQISVNLLETAPVTTDLSVQSQQDGCQQYGYLFDKEANKNISLCRHNYKRNNFIYKSSTNHLQVVLSNRSNSDDQSTFLIGIKAVGCLDLIPPENAWLRRTDNEATVGCYTLRWTWHLRCVDNQWVGVMGNCTHDNEAEQTDSLKPVTLPVDNHQGVAVVVIICLGIALCFIIICIGAVCFQRYKMQISATQKYFQKLEGNGVSFQSVDRQQTAAMLSHPGQL